jgi:hypothetical protein
MGAVRWIPPRPQAPRWQLQGAATAQAEQLLQTLLRLGHFARQCLQSIGCLPLAPRVLAEASGARYRMLQQANGQL